MFISDYTDSTFLPDATPIGDLPTNAKTPTQNTDMTNQNSMPLPKAAFVIVITVAVVSCVAIVLCSGVITGSAIRREVGRRRHRRRRRRRVRERQRHQGRTGILHEEGRPKRVQFAMTANEAYEVTPHHSTTNLGRESSYLESASDVYYEDITPFASRTS